MVVIVIRRLLNGFKKKDKRKIDHKRCNRCNKVIYGGWSSEMAGIDIKFSIGSQSTTHLWGTHRVHEIDFNHPAITSDSGYQKLGINVGYHKPYKLCYNCQSDFMGIVGKFLLEQKGDDNMDKMDIEQEIIKLIADDMHKDVLDSIGEPGFVGGVAAKRVEGTGDSAYCVLSYTDDACNVYNDCTSNYDLFRKTDIRVRRYYKLDRLCSEGDNGIKYKTLFSPFDDIADVLTQHSYAYKFITSVIDKHKDSLTKTYLQDSVDVLSILMSLTRNNSKFAYHLSTLRSEYLSLDQHKKDNMDFLHIKIDDNIIKVSTWDVERMFCLCVENGIIYVIANVYRYTETLEQFKRINECIIGQKGSDEVYTTKDKDVCYSYDCIIYGCDLKGYVNANINHSIDRKHSHTTDTEDDTGACDIISKQIEDYIKPLKDNYTIYFFLNGKLQ